MQDKVKELLTKIKEWWGHFTPKQKTILVALVASVVLTAVILVTVFTRPRYVLLAECETAKEASEITELLTANDIQYQVTDDGLIIQVVKEQEADANLLLGANDILPSPYGIDEVTAGGMSTTEADKQKRYVLYLESRLENDFMGMFSAIRSAHVTLNLPQDDGTLISKNEQAYAMILLELEGEFTTDNAAFLAKAVATAIGNDDTSNITIMDTEANLLYSGEDEYSVSGAASTQLSVKAQAEAMVKNQVTQVLLGTNLYDSIEVASNLDIDFSVYEKTQHDYSAPEGMTQGLYAEAHIFNSESNSGNGGVPGTDSNEPNTYVFQNDANSESSTTEESYKYVPNETITNESRPAGAILYNTSSLSATAISYNIINEEDAERQGLLDGITWEDYKLANSERTKLEVDPELYSVVANATGISTDNITIMAFSENWFVDAEGLALSATDIIQIALIFIILGLLGVVVVRSMMGEKVVEEEDELSLEDLLQSTPEESLENIEVETKSETRKLIEKFVDDNPEAVANLLRNWLNEDWGG